MDVSARAFEATIERSLLSGGVDAAPVDAGAMVAEQRGAYTHPLAGRYRMRGAGDYDRALCLVPRDIFAFLLAR
jgi:hypothetical protein